MGVSLPASRARLRVHRMYGSFILSNLKHASPFLLPWPPCARTPASLLPPSLRAWLKLRRSHPHFLQCCWNDGAYCSSSLSSALFFGLACRSSGAPVFRLYILRLNCQLIFERLLRLFQLRSEPPDFRLASHLPLLRSMSPQAESLHPYPLAVDPFYD